MEVADLDGDGNTDAIAVSNREINGSPWCILTWYRQIGVNEFSEPIILFKERGDLGKPHIDVGDIDLDGDTDIVLVTAEDDSRILWFENMNNASSFTEHFITNMFNENFAKLSDLDSDGDLDLMTGGTRHTEWYENKNGAGNFELAERFYEYFDGSRHIISSDDLDDDGYLDIIYWRGNNGTWRTDDMYIHYGVDNNGNFGDQILLSSDNPPEIVDAVFFDINGDNQKDIITAHGTDGNRSTGVIEWREIQNGVILNNGGILGNNIGLTFLEKLDIDHDGDLDILTCGGMPGNPWNAGVFLIYLNDNNGQFEDAIVIELEKGRLKNVKAKDLNNDGVWEIVGVTTHGLFGLNLSFTSSTSSIVMHQHSIQVTPNPVLSEFEIILPDGLLEYEILIHDLNGNQLGQAKNQRRFNINHLPAGAYILQIEDKRTGDQWIEKIQKL